MNKQADQGTTLGMVQIVEQNIDPLSKLRKQEEKQKTVEKNRRHQ